MQGSGRSLALVTYSFASDMDSQNGRIMLRRHYAEDSLVFRVGMRIRRLRLERRLTLRDFGKLAGVHPFHVMAIELGQSAATTKTLQSIANALGVAPVDLLNCDIENDDMAYIVERMRQDPEAQRMLIAKLQGLNQGLGSGIRP
jgi:transcriptional regulator with XRE-family HTH domain